MPLGTEVGLGLRDIVLDGDRPSSPPLKEHSPKFLVYVSVVAKRLDPGCTKMPLGMEVGLGPGDFVLDRDPTTPPQKAHIFGRCLLWPNGWTDQDGSWQPTLC